jgi:hypothetical protein
VVLTGAVKVTGAVATTGAIVTSQSLQFEATTAASIIGGGTGISDFNKNCTFSVLVRKNSVTDEVTDSGNICGTTFD